MSKINDTYKDKKKAADRRLRHKAAKGRDECHSIDHFFETEQDELFNAKGAR